MGLAINVVTLFPEMFAAVSDYGITGKAVGSGVLQISTVNPRDYATDRHRTVDDRPYWRRARHGHDWRSRCWRPYALPGRALPGAAVTYLSPQGRQLRQQDVMDFAGRDSFILVAGRYEGVDERVIELEVDEEWSIGDYVLSGGELPAMVLIDAVARCLPGALGNEESAMEDSFFRGLLDCPHYTRPEVVAGLSAPPVLLSGDHAGIRKWRLKQALGRTWKRRPDLLEALDLDTEKQALLDEYITEQRNDE